MINTRNLPQHAPTVTPTLDVQAILYRQPCPPQRTWRASPVFPCSLQHSSAQTSHPGLLSNPGSNIMLGGSTGLILATQKAGIHWKNILNETSLFLLLLPLKCNGPNEQPPWSDGQWQEIQSILLAKLWCWHPSCLCSIAFVCKQ